VEDYIKARDARKVGVTLSAAALSGKSEGRGRGEIKWKRETLKTSAPQRNLRGWSNR
jgi:hypothetical protein